MGMSTMLLPPEYAWIELVIIVAVAVYVCALIGNTISFDNRFMNALPTAVVLAVAFSLLVYFRYGTVMLTDWGFAVMKQAP
jgi:Mn2+/Fe2+ NRAMP family transporter